MASDTAKSTPRRGAPCKLCDAFYGDAMGCDESKPPCSPHRTPDGKMGPHPVDYKRGEWRNADGSVWNAPEPEPVGATRPSAAYRAARRKDETV